MEQDQQLRVRGKELDETRTFDGLTYPQLRYCEARAEGLTQLASHRRAYPGWNPAGREQGTWLLERDPRIRDKIHALYAERKQQTSLAPQIEITKEFITQGIAQIAIQEDQVKPNTRLRAYELLGKMAGIDLFRDVVSHETKQKSVEDIDREIAEHLAGLGKMIDVTPSQATEPASKQPPKQIDYDEQVEVKRDRRRKPR